MTTYGVVRSSPVSAIFDFIPSFSALLKQGLGREDRIRAGARCFSIVGPLNSAPFEDATLAYKQPRKVCKQNGAYVQ